VGLRVYRVLEFRALGSLEVPGVGFLGLEKLPGDGEQSTLDSGCRVQGLVSSA
jgi:hypothetical protein